MVNAEHWHKRPTYADIVKEVANDFPVKLPERVALHFYDSFAMAKFGEMQAGVTTLKMKAIQLVMGPWYRRHQREVFRSENCLNMS